MAERDKRSRALRRNLRKQARRGTLSARERKVLLDQEKKFRKARRGAAKGVGLGLAGAAGLLAVPAVQEFLGTAAGRFKSSRDASKAARDEERAKAEQEAAMEKMEEATPTADADQAVAEEVMGVKDEPEVTQSTGVYTAPGSSVDRSGGTFGDMDAISQALADASTSAVAPLDGPSREEFDRLQAEKSTEVQAQGGKVSRADKIRKMIAKKYGIR